MFFRRNRFNHSLLLISVRRGNERLPRHKVRILCCDAAGGIFTQLISRTTYRRIFTEAEKTGLKDKDFAAGYLDTGNGRFRLVLVEISSEENWALERILEHALRNAIIPDILREYPGQIISLFGGPLADGGNKSRQDTAASPRGFSSRVLNRLPYYRPQDMEVSIPIYKAHYSFPLVILKRLPPEVSTPPTEQRVLLLDSDGDLALSVLSSGQLKKADIKLHELQAGGKRGCMVAFKGQQGINVDVITLNALQLKALDTLAYYFLDKGKTRHLPVAVKTVLEKAREIVVN